MNFRASSVKLFAKYDRAWVRAQEVAEIHRDGYYAESYKERRIVLSKLTFLAERLAAARQCNPRMAKAIIAAAVKFAELRPESQTRQALVDAFIRDVRMMIEAERRGRERPEHGESRIVLSPWWGPLPD